MQGSRQLVLAVLVSTSGCTCGSAGGDGRREAGDARGTTERSDSAKERPRSGAGDRTDAHSGDSCGSPGRGRCTAHPDATVSHCNSEAPDRLAGSHIRRGHDGFVQSYAYRSARHAIYPCWSPSHQERAAAHTTAALCRLFRPVHALTLSPALFCGGDRRRLHFLTTAPAQNRVRRRLRRHRPGGEDDRILPRIPPPSLQAKGAARASSFLCCRQPRLPMPMVVLVRPWR